MGACEVRVHGTIQRSERLERAIAKILIEVKKHEEEVQNQKVLANMVG